MSDNVLTPYEAEAYCQELTAFDIKSIGGARCVLADPLGNLCVQVLLFALRLYMFNWAAAANSAASRLHNHVRKSCHHAHTLALPSAAF
jgi:hypothetical protein